ncbi:hypothetical protein ACFYON_27290 [Micromonospora sp. NPDC005686]|uniref:hypothetical protein n=1 Tax=unclassified Micromonospora TaxID=2617518 RepID=UPI0033B57AF0
MKKMKITSRGGAALAMVLLVGGIATPAHAATGPEICGGSEYMRIAAHELSNGRLVVSKHRNSNTMCAVTFNSTGTTKYTRATLVRVPAGGGVTYGSKEDAGQYRQYAGPIYLANQYPNNDFYAEGQVGGNSVQLYCTLTYCAVPR